MGPSGSGKTTLLSLVGGLDGRRRARARRRAGHRDARSRTELAILRRRTVGYVFQGNLNILAGPPPAITDRVISSL